MTEEEQQATDELAHIATAPVWPLAVNWLMERNDGQVPEIGARDVQALTIDGTFESKPLLLRAVENVGVIVQWGDTIHTVPLDNATTPRGRMQHHWMFEYVQQFATADTKHTNLVPQE